MNRRFLKSVDILCAEKRREPSKHYVYKIQTVWSDGSVCFIYRRYRNFFGLQCSLLNKFPEEGNEEDLSKRIIPFLPGKIYFGRSHIRNVAYQRLPLIKDYCQALIELPEKLSQDSLVLNFFEPSSNDLKQLCQQEPKEPNVASGESISWPVKLENYRVICDFSGETTGELKVAKGDVVGVVTKDRNGWCFVSNNSRTSGFAPKQGWVPASYLEPMEQEQAREETAVEADAGEEYVAMEFFEARSSEELTAQKGSIVQVIAKYDNGWYWGQIGSNSGYVPAAYLRAISHPVPIKPAPAVTNGASHSPRPQREQPETRRTSQYDKKPPRPLVPKAKPVAVTQPVLTPAVTHPVHSPAVTQPVYAVTVPRANRLPAATAAAGSSSSSSTTTTTAAGSSSSTTATVAGAPSASPGRLNVKQMASKLESLLQ